jgi:hypothetical protein
MGVYRINKTRLAELVDRTIKEVVEADLTGVTSIGNAAFSYCSGLTTITIPGSVTSIGISAFFGCTSLTTITIPDSVTSIGGYVFNYCSGLTSFHINATSPPTLSSSAFAYSGITTTTGTIYVPTLSVAAYKEATNWSAFADIIVGGTPV